MDWKNPESEAVYVFMDLKAAYDRVLRKHFQKCLLTKMETLGVENTYKSLFSRWVNRQHHQSASMVGQYLYATTQGVTQGSVYAPHLFKMVFEDLYKNDRILKQSTDNFIELAKKWKRGGEAIQNLDNNYL